MSPTTWAATFGSICLLAAVALAVWALCQRATEVRADEAHYRRLAPEPVDRELWEPTAPLWENSATPIYAELAEFKPAENRPHIAAMQARAEAEAEDDDRMWSWLGGAS